MKKCVQLCALVTQRGLKGRQLSELYNITVYSTTCEMPVCVKRSLYYVYKCWILNVPLTFQILFMHIYD